MPPTISLVGLSGSGKTTLAVGLLRHWREEGLAVAYAKHASHGFQMDRPGKDTFRASEAGATAVAITGPGGVVFLDPREETDPLRIVRRFFEDADLVLLEGFRSAALPSVLVVGEDDPSGESEEVPGPLLALVGRGPAVRDAAARRAVPAFEPQEVPALAAHLLRKVRDAVGGARD